MDNMLEEIIDTFKTYNPSQDTALIEKAYDFAKKAHEGQKRLTGEPFFTHAVEVAKILLGHKLDVETISAALLHDTVEDTSTTVKDIEINFNKEISDMVAGLTKIDKFESTSTDEATVENWRKMLIAISHDIRIILIKLADRTHNMKTLHALPAKRQQEKALETLNLYAPLAQRLGMFGLKNELEDLSFKYLHPEEYAALEEGVEKKSEYLDKKLTKFKNALGTVLENEQIPYKLLARVKSHYSIYRKMIKQNASFSQIQDLLGVRIITDTALDCYRALGALHANFKPVAGSFTDYIAMPKINMYQSIHTTIFFEDTPIEVQIRTEDMHRTCEYGIAAHWRYKLGSKADPHLDEKLNWIRQWIEWQRDLTAPREFLESFQTDINLNQIFVFTPKGDVKVLPEHATPLDFAYLVHTEIGEHYSGALVNKKMAKMNSELKSGDVCEIQTKKHAEPKLQWLEAARTARARSKIKVYLRGKGIDL
ncbi:MAG: RelA/SpoT family protein [Elusimicrobiota bacterium]|jgi:GTP pyrophosphokinase|nr:RelA/SpoT family protein [Elusimicrobiota bacterium]